MKVEVKNLGIIKEATVDLSKKMIILCGPNGTGKTYLSYLLNAILDDNSGFNFRSFQSIQSSILGKGVFTLSLAMINEFLEQEANNIKKSLGVIFGLPEDKVLKMFKNFELLISLDKDDLDTISQTTFKFKFSLNDQNNYTFTKKEGLDVFIEKIKGQKESPQNDLFKNSHILNIAVCSFIRKCAYTPIGDSHMLTVERNSIYTFKTELSLSRNELVDQMLDMKERDNLIISLLEHSSRRYPLAIRESLKIANDLVHIQSLKSPYYDIGEIVETSLLNGKVMVNRNGDVEFVPEHSARTRLPFHMASSSVKTLSSLIIFLKHIAGKNTMLIIDEPEMNIHPNNQILLAQLFAVMVNSGIRIIVSTHSDYFIREFNNLIMAYNLVTTEDTDVPTEYSLQSKTYLNPQIVEVDYFGNLKRNKVVAESLPIDYKKGFNVKSIDDAIDKQNENSDILYNELLYQSNRNE